MEENISNPKNPAISYIPFLFFYMARKYGNLEIYMFHAKMGAIGTVMFVIALITAAYISELIGGIFYGIFFAFAGFNAYKAHKAYKTPIKS